jgi:hypothetical protein
MKLPWVSRTAYELLLDERDRLRAKKDALKSAARRKRRKQRGAQ